MIGLEVHVQLATRTKAFAPVAVAYGAPPNSLTDPIVLGLPGALPTFNAAALAAAVRLGLATGSTVRTHSRFSRKHYFYPDLPKGYQISQHDEPLCAHGHVDVWHEGVRHQIALERIHLEEDAGKLNHDGATSRVDLNRAGVPLVEVVTAPVLPSAELAFAYMKALHRLVRYLGVCEGDLEKGHLRCDANVSVRRRGDAALGTRVELKNINSFRFVRAAIEHEIARQIRVLDGGGRVERETRLWDGVAGMSQSMRGKEEVADYRYLPDPDLPPLALDAAELVAARAALPELPADRLARYLADYQLAFDDADLLTSEVALADYLDRAIAACGPGHARALAAWIVNELLRELAGRPITACAVAPAALAELIVAIDDGTISGKLGKDVFAKMIATGDGARAIIAREGLRQLSDPAEVRALAEAIVAANPRQAAQYRAGKDTLLGFFVGQLMKATGGRVNPQLASDTLKALLAG
ncbi:MAG: Asp-tRNA(Asn)/Glu-tRNA(Gln) amidotransferase subunit GatB [Myxococcales bacterium]|nr:Asp-tRNA(Asn)/Glu-tRNA(Gln) amidotransferase subunit GatB [Myxococcales bacterium]